MLPLPLLVTVIVVVAVAAAAAAAVAGVVVCCHVLAVLGSYWGGAVGTLLFPWPWHVAIPRPGFCCLKSPSVVYLHSFRHPPLGHKLHVLARISTHDGMISHEASRGFGGNCAPTTLDSRSILPFQHATWFATMFLLLKRNKECHDAVSPPKMNALP